MAQVERAENLAPETEKLDRKSVKGRMQDNKTVTDIANQLRTTRQAFINRVQLTKEIPLPEKHPFIQKAERAKQEEDLFQVQKEFDRHLEESRKRIEAVHKIIDEHRDILRRGEDQELLTNVMQMTFEQKQKAVTEIDRMLAEREKMMEGTKGLDKKQQEALGKDMEKLSPKERLAKLKDIEKTNKLFQSYKKLWEKHWDKISEQTIAEFCEWFLNDVPPHRQEWALQKAEKEDILPRVKLFDIHAKLPSEYQAKDFKEMGLTERKNYLLQAERRLDNDYAKLLWSPQIDMSDDSKRFAERSFTALKGTEKLLLKAEFFQNFPEQAKTEARLREQLQRYPQKLWQPLAEKFNKSKFEGKVQIIQQVGKLDHEYQVLRREMTSLSPKVRAHYEEKFEGADSFDAMKALLKKGKEFSRFRDKYFKLLDENEHHFSADPSFRERLYDEKVTNLEQAKKAYEELKVKAKFRKALTDRYEKLDPTLQARCKNFFKRRPDEKRAALEKLEGVAKVMPTIDMLKKTARDFEQKKDFPEALKFYREALRLDPDDEWSKVKVQSLSLKLGISKTPEKTKKGEETEEAVDTKKVEGKIENIIDLHGEDVERLRDLRAAYHEMQKSSEVLGAHGTETERSAKLRAQKEFELKGGKGEEESAILEKLYTEDREAIIDTEGKLGKKHVVRHQKGVDAEGLRMLGQELRVEHKTDINRGRADIEFRQADGRQLSVKETHTFNNREFEIQVDAMTARLLMDLKQDRKQGEARIREMMEEKLRREVRSKAA